MKSESNINKNKKDKDKENKNNEKKNIDDNDKKDKIKKEKLGKLFHNLNQENNIINAIKEQFLDWTNKNNFPLKTKIENNKKQYNFNTFNNNYKYNTNIEYNEKDENNYEINIKEFERKINILKKKLILFCLKIKNNKY